MGRKEDYPSGKRSTKDPVCQPAGKAAAPEGGSPAGGREADGAG